MKILITIPHYYNPTIENHGSYSDNPLPRIKALSKCILNLHALFGKSQAVINIVNRTASFANQKSTNQLDVIICTANQKHILDKINVSKNLYAQINSELENPKFLGFECQKVLKENFGKYDYYCFMEDDLIINDSQFFKKLNWFNAGTEFTNLLQPNRYETSTAGNVLKCYVDGDINPRAIKDFQNINEQPYLHANFLGENMNFKRPLNPHSGCFFLNKKQMEYWISQPYFLDKDASFISPLESSASLGIMKTFRVYKPEIQNANFLEIQHYGDMFLRMVGNKIPIVS